MDSKAQVQKAQLVKQDMEREMEAYRKIQSDMQKAIQSRSQLQSQEIENQGVLEELGRLGDDANVYKLIGPALIKQDLVEAKSNVSKRLEYIKAELERADGQIKTMEGRSKDRENELMKLEKKMQALGVQQTA